MIRFYFDFTSPYTYLASTQVEGLAARTGATIEWLPALLGGIMKATGNQAPALLPARAAYMMQDLPRWAEVYGVPFRWSPHFPLATMAALRTALYLEAEAPARDGEEPLHLLGVGAVPALAVEETRVVELAVAKREHQKAMSREW